MGVDLAAALPPPLAPLLNRPPVLLAWLAGWLPAVLFVRARGVVSAPLAHAAPAPAPAFVAQAEQSPPCSPAIVPIGRGGGAAVCVRDGGDLPPALLPLLLNRPPELPVLPPGLLPAWLPAALLLIHVHTCTCTTVILTSSCYNEDVICTRNDNDEAVICNLQNLHFLTPPAAGTGRGWAVGPGGPWDSVRSVHPDVPRRGGSPPASRWRWRGGLAKRARPARLVDVRPGLAGRVPRWRPAGGRPRLAADGGDHRAGSRLGDPGGQPLGPPHGWRGAVLEAPAAVLQLRWRRWPRAELLLLCWQWQVRPGRRRK